jgi:LuxR family maltose regulon positive regulatory protein
MGLVSRGRLFGRLERAGRVALVSTPAGSGKTVLLRSWIGKAGLADRAAWVSAGQDWRDPQQFWLSVADGLRGTVPGGGLVRPLTAAPDLDGWAVVERLLEDLGTLRERVWLIVDDLHELECDTTLAQLELLVRHGPPELRIVLAARHGLRLGLHQLRLEGELTELGAADLRFTPAEARALLDAAGARLADPALASLVERTEGWAAGLRLAALSLAGHRDPERFAAEFCGSERTVAEYLLAEVLDRQSEQVRRLLLRTSVLDRVNGELADLLTGDCGGERMLQELETANAFVVSVDAARSWFRCHRLFGDLLQLELRRTAPGDVTGLHHLAAQWFADHGLTLNAARHAQQAQDWRLATQLLAGRQRGNLPAVAEEARPLPAAAQAPDAVQPDLGEELRALALINLGITEVWSTQFDQAHRHLEQGVELARRIGQPFLEFTGLAYQTPLESHWSLTRATERGMQAVGLAQQHGWTDDPAAGVAYVMLANSLLWQGRPEEAEPWVWRAERSVRPEAEPAAGLAA